MAADAVPVVSKAPPEAALASLAALDDVALAAVALAAVALAHPALSISSLSASTAATRADATVMVVAVIGTVVVFLATPPTGLIVVVAWEEPFSNS